MSTFWSTSSSDENISKVCFEGVQIIKLPSGQSIKTTILLKREIDKSARKFSDWIVTSGLGGMPPNEYQCEATLDATLSKASYETPLFVAQLELVGEPWNWTSSRLISTFKDGRTGSGDAHFTADGLTQQHSVLRDGNQDIHLNMELKIVDFDHWDKMRKWILGGDS